MSILEDAKPDSSVGKVKPESSVGKVNPDFSVGKVKPGTSVVSSHKPLGQPTDEENRRPIAMVTETSEQEVMEFIANESVMDRLQYLTKVDDSSRRYHEAAAIRQTVCLAAIGMGSFTFLRSWPLFVDRFNRANKHTAFATHFRATRHRYDATLQLTLKSSGLWALRGGLFAGAVMTVAQVIPLLRNKSGVIEYTAGTALAGALARTMLGPRGMLGGGILGGVLGTIAGLVIHPAQVYVGETQDIIHYRRVKGQLDNKRFLNHIQQRNAEQLTSSLSASLPTEPSDS